MTTQIFALNFSTNQIRLLAKNYFLICQVPIIEYDTYNIQNIILFLPCGNIKVKEQN